jgi:ATP-dependent DNA helicase RecG
MVGEGGITLRELDARPVTDLNGVGEARARALAAAEVHSIMDLLGFYPRRYLDRTREATVAGLSVGDEGMVLVRVGTVSSRRTRNRRSLVEARVSDDTGELRLTFFNQPWRVDQLKVGMQAVVFGRLDSYQGNLRMTNPVVDLVGDRTGRIVAIYPQSETAGLHSWDVDGIVAEALRRVMKVRGLSDPLPGPVRERYGLVGRSDAYRAIHRPGSLHEMGEARRRLVFDELLRIQLALVQRKVDLERTSVGIAHDVGATALLDEFRSGLGFQMTTAQDRVVDEILADLARPAPMHRLLQGDVGSGKTVVAVAAMLVAVQGGHQAAVMVPTEVLAEQHHTTIAGLLDAMTVSDPATLLGHRPLKVDLLTSSTTAGERRRIGSELLAGGVDVLIGTHALIQEGVEFGSLGVVVIDEQHRFGVEQRAALRDKNRDGTAPDVLVMTATPIPRTAAMTV